MSNVFRIALSLIWRGGCGHVHPKDALIWYQSVSPLKRSYVETHTYMRVSDILKKKERYVMLSIPDTNVNLTCASGWSTQRTWSFLWAFYILTLIDSQSNNPRYSRRRTRQHAGVMFKFNIQATSSWFKFTVSNKKAPRDDLPDGHNTRRDSPPHRVAYLKGLLARISSTKCPALSARKVFGIIRGITL